MRTIKTRHFTGTTDNTVTKRELDNRKVARRAAAEGMVLLKNEGILPLKEGTKIALYGVGASRTIKGGTGSGDVNERETVSIYQGMKNALDLRLRQKTGSRISMKNTRLPDMHGVMSKRTKRKTGSQGYQDF